MWDIFAVTIDGSLRFLPIPCPTCASHLFRCAVYPCSQSVWVFTVATHIQQMSEGDTPGFAVVTVLTVCYSSFFDKNYISSIVKYTKCFSRSRYSEVGMKFPFDERIFQALRQNPIDCFALSVFAQCERLDISQMFRCPHFFQENRRTSS